MPARGGPGGGCVGLRDLVHLANGLIHLRNSGALFARGVSHFGREFIHEADFLNDLLQSVRDFRAEFDAL